MPVLRGCSRDGGVRVGNERLYEVRVVQGQGGTCVIACRPMSSQRRDGKSAE